MIARDGWSAKTGLAAVLAVGLALTGCAGGGVDSPGSAKGSEGEGLPASATKDQFIDAFEDVEPIHLYTQTPAPKGGAAGQNIESYVAQVEEWSGGKITFDIAYANAVAGATEIDDALNDGRLDLANIVPVYEPSDYPATNALIDAGILNDGSAVVGTLQANAWANEVAFNTPEIMDEWDRNGLVPLMPIFNGGANGLFCSQERNSLDSFQGNAIAAAGTLQGRQVETLGGSPVSIVYTEVFESLQRGVVECVIQNAAGAVLGGFVEEAPHVVIDEAAPLGTIAGAFAFSKSKWDSLPLVARQLLWDSMSVYFEETITVKAWPTMADLAEEVQRNGGSFSPLDDPAREALLELHAKTLDELRASEDLDGQALVDNSTEAAERWTSEIKDLGFDPDVEYRAFADWWSESVDISSYTDKVMTDIYGPQRPR